MTYIPLAQRRPALRTLTPAGHTDTGLVSWCGEPGCVGSKACRACRSAYARQWRTITPLNDEQRRKSNARSHANVYQRRGVLIPQPCACGSTDVEKHHPDYDQPTFVILMCRQCHLSHHQKERKVLTANSVSRETGF